MVAFSSQLKDFYTNFNGDLNPTGLFETFHFKESTGSFRQVWLLA